MWTHLVNLVHCLIVGFRVHTRLKLRTPHDMVLHALHCDRSEMWDVLANVCSPIGPECAKELRCCIASTYRHAGVNFMLLRHTFYGAGLTEPYRLTGFRLGSGENDGTPRNHAGAAAFSRPQCHSSPPRCLECRSPKRVRFQVQHWLISIFEPVTRPESW